MTCDGKRCSSPGPLKLVPIGPMHLRLCRECYEEEMARRRHINQTFGEAIAPTPTWEEAKEHEEAK